MTNVLVTDDELSLRETLCLILKKAGFAADSASDVQTALNMMSEKAYDIIITDIIMPKVSGMEFVRKIRAGSDSIQVIVMTGEPTVETAVLAVQYGANDYVVKPIDRTQLLKTVKNAENIKKLSDEKLALEKENIRYQKSLEQLVEKKTQELRNTMQSIISLLSTVVESRDPYTAGHQRRVGNLAAGIAQKMGYPAGSIEIVRITGYIHDLGKITIPSEILSKPGRLNSPEMQLIKTHSVAGADMIGKSNLPDIVANIVLQHHERCDGSGYPNGLMKSAILPEAGILIVADVVEAMTSHRPYRPALGLDAAIGEITRKSGILYPSEAVEACVSLLTDDHYEFEDTEYVSLYF